MNSKDIRLAVFALVQEVAHFHMVNSTEAMTLGDVEDRLGSYYPIANEKNVTNITLETVDFIGFMAGNYNTSVNTAAYVAIGNQITIIATRDSVELCVRLGEDEDIRVYDYARLINDAHIALGTGKQLDLKSYDLAQIIRDMDREV